MDRRVKAGLIALLAAMVAVVAVPLVGVEDDQWLLRLLCAGYPKYSLEWWAFGCWALNDPPNPMAVAAMVVALAAAVVG